MTRPAASPLDRRRAEGLGRLAETLCAWQLRVCGYRILSRRLRFPVGELDIVARRGRLVAFIEVKARRRRPAADEYVTRHQQRRIERAATLLLAEQPALRGCDIRFDVMLVLPWHLPIHVKDAWRPDG